MPHLVYEKWPRLTLTRPTGGLARDMAFNSTGMLSFLLPLLSLQRLFVLPSAQHNTHNQSRPATFTLTFLVVSALLCSEALSTLICPSTLVSSHPLVR